MSTPVELNAKDVHVFRSDDDPVPRDRWGRPLVVPPDGGPPVAYTRCTTFVGVLEDTYQLSLWQQRMVAIGMAERPDLQMAAYALRDAQRSGDKQGKRELNKICSKAIEVAGGSVAANTGTALHSLSEKVDRGEDLGPVPEVFKADLRAYWSATRELEVVAVEDFVVVDDLRVGGTFDRLVKYRGRHYIADIKTGGIDFGIGKIAMQLSMYSRGVRYDHTTQERSPLPEDVSQERGIVIHLPAGQQRCTLHWVDLAAAWDAIGLAAQVREWRARKGLSVPFGEGEGAFDDH